MTKRVFWGFIKLLLSAVFLCAIAGVVYVASVVVRASFEDINIDDYILSLSTQIYYENKETGNFEELEGVYGTESRIWVPLTDMPEHLYEACIAIEDERFYKHHGFDLKRTLGATFIYIFDRESGYGGSTITQQLVKNITGQDDRSADRKIKEIWNAIRLEQKYSKEQILEYYLNTVYFSQGCNGVGAAADVYFSKKVSELTIAEAASIVGITQYPTRYDPFINPEQNKEKQELVLNKMLELGYINDDEYYAAVNEQLNFHIENMKSGEEVNSYFVEQVISDVANDLVKYKNYQYEEAMKLINSGGFKIYATIDVDAQKKVDEIYGNPANFASGLQSSIVIMDPATGEIKALCGGVGKKEGNLLLNRVTGSKRQPGSSIKPIAVYAPAIEAGMIMPSTVFVDEKIKIQDWEPKNSYSGFKGSLSVQDAVRFSTNTIAVKVLDLLGVNSSFNFLRDKLGITTLVDSRVENGKTLTDKNLAALALGGLTDGLTLSELTAAYAPFSNGGMYIPPHTYTKVMDNNGKTILDNSDISVRAISSQTADIMTNILSGVTKSGGTGSAAALNNMASAGKTGTTDENYDKWFIGYTPYYLCGVWCGYDIPKQIPNAYVNPAVTVWNKVMNRVHEGLEYKSFNSMPSTVNVAVCAKTGLLHTPYCDSQNDSNKVIKTYSYSNVPRNSCPPSKHNKKTSYEALGGYRSHTEVKQNVVKEEKTDEPAENTPSENSGGNTSAPPQENSVTETPEPSAPPAAPSIDVPSAE